MLLRIDIQQIYEPRCEKNGLRGVQPQKMARGLKFRILEVEGLYYLCIENKGADLRLCFRICKKPVFSRRGSYGGQPDLIYYHQAIYFSYKLPILDRLICHFPF